MAIEEQKKKEYRLAFDSYKKRIETIIKVVEEIKNKNPDMTAKELEEDLSDEYLEVISNYLEEIEEVAGLQFQESLARYYKDHLSEAVELFRNFRNGDVSTAKNYRPNFEEVSKVFVQDITSAGEEVFKGETEELASKVPENNIDSQIFIDQLKHSRRNV